MPNDNPWVAVADEPIASANQWTAVADEPIAPVKDASPPPSDDEINQLYSRSQQRARQDAIPHELRGYTPDELAQPTQFVNPRTGQHSTVQGTLARVPVLDDPTQGVTQVADGAAQMTRPDGADVLRGAGKVGLGALNVASPVLAGLGATNPVQAAKWIAISQGLGYGGEKAAGALGANPEDAREIGQVAGAVPMVYGFGKMGVEGLANQRAATRAHIENYFENQARGRELGQTITGDDGITLPNGWKVDSIGGTTQARPVYEITDQNGQRIYADNGANVQNFLRQRGILPQGPDLTEPPAQVEQAEKPQAEAQTQQALDPEAPTDRIEPSPIPAKPITAATPTVPEDPTTMDVQLEQLAQGLRRVVMYPTGTPLPDDYPPNVRQTADEWGNVYLYTYDKTDPRQLKPADIKKAARTNRLPEILGSTASGMGAPDKTELQGEPAAVVVRDAQGNEVQSTATDEASVANTMAAAQEVLPPGGTVQLEPISQPIADRLGVPASPEPAPEPIPVPPAIASVPSIINLDGMGQAITANLYDMLWRKLQKGDLTEAGAPSRILKKAKPLYDSGILKNPQDLADWVKAGEQPVPVADEPIEAPTAQPAPKVEGGLSEKSPEQAAAVEKPAAVAPKKYKWYLDAENKPDWLDDIPNAPSWKDLGEAYDKFYDRGGRLTIKDFAYDMAEKPAAVAPSPQPAAKVHGIINTKDTVYHATTTDNLAGIFDTGAINTGSRGFVSTSRLPQIKTTFGGSWDQAKAVTLVLDKGQLPKLSPTVEREFTTNDAKYWLKTEFNPDADLPEAERNALIERMHAISRKIDELEKERMAGERDFDDSAEEDRLLSEADALHQQHFRSMNPRFEFESRANKPLPISAVKAILINREGLLEEAKQRHDSAIGEEQAYIDKKVDAVRALAARHGIPVREYATGNEMAADRVRSSPEVGKKPTAKPLSEAGQHMEKIKAKQKAKEPERTKVRKPEAKTPKAEEQPKPKETDIEKEVLRMMVRPISDLSVPDTFGTHETYSYKEMTAALHSLVKQGRVERISMPDGDFGFKRKTTKKGTNAPTTREPESSTENGTGIENPETLASEQTANGEESPSEGATSQQSRPSGESSLPDQGGSVQGGTRNGSDGRTGETKLDDSERERPGRPADAGDVTKETAGGDYRITDTDRIGEGSPKQKTADNLKAIRIVKQLNGQPATKEQQAELAKYVGWGGLPQIFDERKMEWAGAREELKNLLTDDEYKAASASTLNAHYTSPMVIDAMWKAMERLGLKPKASILEPSMGVGSFFGLQPEATLPARRTGIELDSITGQIARALYPDSNVQIMGFEKIDLPDDFFDVAISNVPFGNYPVYDPVYRKRNKKATSSIHNYFFVKSLDLVRPGGIVAYITSRYTMDAQNPELREMIADKANLLGMVRLPDTAFKGNAGTDVVTDIVFLQKRAPGEAQSGPSFTATKEVSVDGMNTRINEYYVEHGEMLLGKLSMSGTMANTSEPQQTLKGKLEPGQIEKALEALPAGVFQEWSTPKRAERETAGYADEEEVKDGGYTIKDGVLVQRDGSVYRPATLKGKAAERVRGMIPIKDAFKQVISTQRQDASEKDIEAARAKLNKVYDSFVKVHGFINSQGNSNAMGEDPDYDTIAGALENWDSSEKTATKTDIFSKRTIVPPKRPESADSAAQALAISLNESGGIDWNLMQDLTGKTPDELRNELGSVVFQDPTGRSWEMAEDYLSGNVREKLRKAEAAAKSDRSFERNVEALQAIQPVDLKPHEIKITLGANWIPPSDVEDFIKEVLDISAKVSYAPAVAAWSVNNRYSRSTANTETFGNRDYSGHELLQLALNGKAPRIYRKEGDSTVFDKEATVLAQGLQDSIKEAFREWLWKDEKRAERLAHDYNQNVNNIVVSQPDGSHLQLSGSNPAITLRKHQKDVIWRAIKHGNTLLAHEVGAGKTWALAGIAMEHRRLGLANKPALVVPNHMAEQFTNEFLQLYPGARLLTIGKEDFSPSRRQKAVARVSGGDWDCIIIRHKSFEKIPISIQTFKAFIDEQVKELREAMEVQKKEAGAKDATVKQIEKAIKRLETKLQNRLKLEDKDKGSRFEDLGIDMLLVDEAHAFKNLQVITRSTRVAGIPTAESNRATDMFLKTQYVFNQKQKQKRGIIFATGTPVTNTMAELYNMQRYLQLPTMKEYNVSHFDAWKNMFGEVKRGVELDVSGKGFRENERFAKFINIPELMRMYRMVADVRTARMLNLPRPELFTGGPQAITSEASPELTAYVDHLVDRAETIRGGHVDPKVDNMLKVVSEGKKAALDPRLVDPAATDRPFNKANKAVDNIYRIWKATAEDKATQIVFCDLSVPLSAKAKKAKKQTDETPATNEVDDEGPGDREAIPEAAGEKNFSVYDDMRAKLIDKGVPGDQIAFIHDYNGDTQKQQLFDAVNAGRIRVIMGSTEKMGVGTNIQKRAIALHHMDSPWRPADVTQRDGRIWRQGNMHKQVHIFQYLTEGSFDAYSWQLLENKAQFIDKVQGDEMTAREMEDIGMTLPSAAEFKAMASGNPLIKEKIGTDAEVARLELARNAYAKQQKDIKYQISQLPEQIEASEKRIASLTKDQETVKANPGAMTLGKKKFEGDDARKEFAAALDKSLDSWKETQEPQLIGTFRGLTLYTKYVGKKIQFDDKGQSTGYAFEKPDIIIKGEETYTATTNQHNPSGTVQSLEAKARSIADGDAIAISKSSVKDDTKKLNDLKELLGRKWKDETRYQDLLVKKAEIDAQLAESEAEKAGGDESDGDDVQVDEEGARVGGPKRDLTYHQRKAIEIAKFEGRAAPTAEQMREMDQSPETVKDKPAAKLPGDISTYKPGKAKPLEIKDGKPFYGELDGKPFYSNGHVLIQGSPDEKIEGVQLQPNAIQSVKEKYYNRTGDVPIKPVAFEVKAKGQKTLGPKRVVYFDNGAAVDSEYFDFVKHEVPGATFKGPPEASDDTNSVSVMKGDEQVGVIMALRATPPSEHTQKIIKQSKSVILGSGLGALQPAAEVAGKAVKDYFLQEAVPAAERILLGGKAIGKTMAEVFAPRIGVPTESLDALYKMRGGRAAAEYVISRQLDKWSHIFDGVHPSVTIAGKKFAYSPTLKGGMSRDQMVDFVDRVKTGQKQPTQELQDLADFMREVDNSIYAELQRLNPKAAWLDNHFRVMWKPASLATAKGKSFISRRPLEGTKGFLKHHTLNDMSEGLQKGLEPYSYNPLTMFQLTYADALKYISAQDYWEQLGNLGMRVWIKHGRRGPENFVKLDDKIASKWFKVKEGMVHAGDWWVEKNTARVLSNYLSRDKIREHAFGRGMMAIKNATTALELSLSPFHAVFESVEALSSQMNIAVRTAANVAWRQKKPSAYIRAAKELAKVPTAFVSAARLGSMAKQGLADPVAFANSIKGQEWIKSNPEALAGARAFFDGGGLARMSRDYRVQQFNSFIERWNSASAQDPKHYIAAAVAAIPALNQKIMKPLFEHYIPNLKMGFFIKEFALAKEENEDRLASGEMTETELARNVLDSIENRFGEMNFDNLYWDRTMKSVMQLAFRSITWVLGNVRNIESAAAGQAYELHRAFKNKERPMLDMNAGWVLSTLLVVAVLGSAYYLLTHGRLPKTLGELTEGMASVPSYFRDAMHMHHDPKGYLVSKFASFIGKTIEVARNEDYYHVRITGPGEPFTKQALENLWHLAPKPFSVSGFFTSKEQGASSAQQWANMLGFGQIPYYLKQSKAEQLASEFLKDNPRVKSKQEWAHILVMSALRKAIKEGDDKTVAEIEKRNQETHILAPKDFATARKTAHDSPLMPAMKSDTLTLAQKFEVYKAATPEEKKAIAPYLRMQAGRARSQPWKWTPQAAAMGKQFFDLYPYTQNIATPEPIQ